MSTLIEIAVLVGLLIWHVWDYIADRRDHRRYHGR
jgi:hypothetical protein